MLLNPCSETKELLILRSLNSRLNLSTKEKQYYINLEKGYEGEKKFEKLLENQLSDFLILSDLLLEKNNTVFQIDSTLIFQKKIHLFEVKNYEGDFYIEKDIWYSRSGTEINNPLEQLKRSESLFRRLLQDLRLTLPVEAHLIFINPEFTLYQAPMNPPIILPTQLNHFIKKINMTSSKLNGSHTKLAEQLLSLHITESPFTRISQFEYNQLKKGITCATCNSFMTSFIESNLICDKCHCSEEIDTAILRNVEQFILLFPDRKITTNSIHEWCMVIESKKTIRRVLTKHFTHIKHARFSYFVQKK
jgi:hypothetical protein